MFRQITPEKLIEKRGERSRKAVAGLVDNKITEQDLYAYEKGKYEPSKRKLPYLLKALGATYEEVSEPVELSLV